MVSKRFLAAAILALVVLIEVGAAPTDGDESLPKPILTPQRLRRLQREKDRQMPRWMNFDNRVRTVVESPERGFELALYYAVTKDTQRGKEAVSWAVSHPQDVRQRQIVADWCADLLSEQQRNEWLKPTASSGVIKKSDSDLSPNQTAIFFLLSQRPADLDHPSWRTHVRALALVAENPNLSNVQFLQSWVLQGDQTIRDGPGVGYEFFWADPYLPGVSYQNMDPWLYDDSGILLARSDWTPKACWISISKQRLQQQDCPPNWQAKPVNFGHLLLIKMPERCLQLSPTARNMALVLWGLPPKEKVTYRYQKKQASNQTDPAGMLRVPTGVEGKVCAAR